MNIIQWIIDNDNIIQVIFSLCMLLVTILYVVFTWKQSKYTKQAFLEAVKQTREGRQPCIIPTIERVSGAAFATSNSTRVQLNFHCKLVNDVNYYCIWMTRILMVAKCCSPHTAFRIP